MAGAFCWFGEGDRPAWGADASWMLKAKYGIFMHYQYRILLDYSVATKPSFPGSSQMTAPEWNRLVDGFDVEGFANQMAEAKVGWVMFCLDDHYFAWPCAPNKAFSEFTGGFDPPDTEPIAGSKRASFGMARPIVATFTTARVMATNSAIRN